MVNIAGYEIPNKPDELTVEQFDKINAITSSVDMDEIEKWIEKFKYLGVPEDAFDDMEFKDFQQCVKDWNDQPNYDKNKTMSVEIDGYTYEAKESIGVKDLGLIEKVWKQNDANFAAHTLAILFKRTDLSKTEHYTPAHIKQKTKLFKQLKSSVAIPYIIEILSKLTESAKQYTNEVTEQLEASQD